MSNNEVTKFSVFHLNIQGVSDKSNELELLLADYTPDIVCLSEHFLDVNHCKQFTIDGWYTAASFGRTVHQRGGVSIYCRDEEFVVLEGICDLSVELHCEVVAVKLLKYNMIILTFYRSPKYGDFEFF